VAKNSIIQPLGPSWFTGAYDPLTARWPAGNKMRATVIDALELKPGMRLLELGCGSGRLAIQIKRTYPDVEITAVDGNRDIMKVAKNRAGQAGVDIDFVLGDFTTCPLEGTYDRVYSTLVLHHLNLEAKQEVFARIRALLAEDGKLVVADFTGHHHGPGQAILSKLSTLSDPLGGKRSNHDGSFEAAMRDTLPVVRSVARIPSVFGTIEAWECSQ
jgi:ubiquinone/menaquinone biosynthesis C-methylase UbiE